MSDFQDVKVTWIFCESEASKRDVRESQDETVTGHGWTDA
jgi:hypothetical protein